MKFECKLVLMDKFSFKKQSVTFDVEAEDVEEAVGKLYAEAIIYTMLFNPCIVVEQEVKVPKDVVDMMTEEEREE
jgi:hypothetical protein